MIVTKRMTQLLNSRVTAFLQAVEAVENFASSNGIGQVHSRQPDTGIIGLQFLFSDGEAVEVVLEIIPIFQTEASDLAVRVYHPEDEAEDDYSSQEYSEVEDALLALKEHFQANSSPQRL